MLLLRQSAIYLASRLVAAPVTFLTLAVYTRILSPSEYGLYTLVSAGIMLALTIGMMWISSSALRLYSAAADKAEFLSSVLITYILTLLLLSVGSLPILLFLTDAFRPLLLLGLLNLAVAGWLEINLGLLSARLEAQQYGLVNIARLVLSSAFGAALAWAGAGVHGVLVGSAVGTAIPAAYLAGHIWRDLPFRFRVASVLRELLTYGVPLCANHGLSSAARYADRLLLGGLRDSHSVGLYGAGYQLADQTIAALLSPIGNAALPIAVRALEDEGVEAARSQLRQSFILLSAIGLPAAAGLMVVASNLAALVVGADYRDTVTEILPVIAAAAFVSALRANYFDHAFQLSRTPWRLVTTKVVAALVTAAALLYCIPAYGTVGAAYATLLSSVANLMLSWLLGHRAFPMPIPILDLMRIIVATGLMVVVVYALPMGADVLALISQVAAGAITYILASMALNLRVVRSIRGLRRAGSRYFRTDNE